ncbi:MAG: hypothetical protein P8M11_16385 [Planctomycetota bacterium]|nr:hypothetical protein [Planctomycetota bacterium]
MTIGEARLPLGDAAAGSPRAVVLGLRPDRFWLAEPEGPCALEATAAGVEDLGDRCEIHLQVGHAERVARRPAGELSRWTVARPAEASLFDPGPRGARIRRRGRPRSLRRSPPQTPFPVEASGHDSMNNHQANALISALVFLAGAVLLSVNGYSAYETLGELTMAVGGVLLIMAWFRMNREG